MLYETGKKANEDCNGLLCDIALPSMFHGAMQLLCAQVAVSRKPGCGF